MTLLHTILYFIVAISILVVIHEYGHFWVARRMGVKVLRFSVGFGKPLFELKDRHGTAYSVAPIPLGGYVKMLDSREAPVPDHLADQDFNQKSPWARIAIAAAGPLANFIFAILVYWALFIGGTTSLIPVISGVDQGTPAAAAGFLPGDEILSVDSEPTTSWQDVSWQLLGHIGESLTLPVEVRGENGQERTLQLTLKRYLADADQPEPITGLGLVPRLPEPGLTIQDVLPESAAAAAGLRAGDELVSLNGDALTSWRDWVDGVRAAAGQEILVGVLRNGEPVSVLATPRAVELESGETVGQIGVTAQSPEIPDAWLRESYPGPLRSLQLGIEKTGQMIVFTLEASWKMLSGELPVKNLSGPISIAKVAGDSASGGLLAFAGFLALLSVSLGVFNLLPVPILDGGHIVFYSAELIRGRPLPESVQIAAVKMGMFLLLMLMSVAFYNDISRL
ncbi:MAG: RIP metalloprotease RseP [Oceanospirillaceae bacterium]|nr:RIP metalloprotease RseP [Oceanospirillaceae bacterium]